MNDQYWKVSRAIIFLKNQFPQSRFVALASVRADYGIRNLTLPSEIITKQEGFDEDFIRIYTMDADDKFNPSSTLPFIPSIQPLWFNNDAHI